MSSAEPRWSTSSNRSETFKFPDFETSPAPRERLAIHEEELTQAESEKRGSSPSSFPRVNGGLHSGRWQARKDHHVAWANGQTNGVRSSHRRQKSLSDAIRTIRTRKGSVSANALEIADALKAPVSIKLIVGTLYTRPLS